MYGLISAQLTSHNNRIKGAKRRQKLALFFLLAWTYYALIRDDFQHLKNLKEDLNFRGKE